MFSPQYVVMIKRPNISRKAILRFLIFVSAIAIVTSTMPRDNQDKYEYEEGKRWNYSTLIAPFDYPIEMESERQKFVTDSIKENFIPIYQREDDKSEVIINKFSKDIMFSVLSPIEKQQLVSTLRNLYRIGIIDSKGGTTPKDVRIKSDHTHITTYPSNSFYTPIQAYRKIDSLIEADNLRNKLPQIEIDKSIIPNVVMDTIGSEEYLNNELRLATRITRIVTQGERIVGRGDKITSDVFNAIRCYEKVLVERNKSSHNNNIYPLLGSIILIAISFAIVFAYLNIYKPKLYASMRMLLFLVLTITTFTVFAFLMVHTFSRGIYMVPFTIIPIIVLVFVDARTAFLTYMSTIILTAGLTHFMWDFIMMQFVAGFVALISIKELSKRSQLIQSAALIFLAYAISYLAIELMQNGSFENVQLKLIGALAINAVFISFAYILVFIVEKLFGFISRVTLVELSDINHPLLRELSEECPGTFQHSLAVSNIAAAAASHVGANVQLVRTGALYHDIGKISNPAFFTENQHGVNPHNVLTPLQSARIVIGHVMEGVKRAEKAKIPSRIRDFILEHHGRGTARYFYTTYCNEHPNETIDAEPFSYPGPNPQSIETSILMMADAIEAASRSLTDYSPESISNLVNMIIDTQVREGLHNDSPISFRDISEIKKSFEASLINMFHSRISYPDAVNPSTK